MLVSIPAEIQRIADYGYLKGKSSLMIYEKVCKSQVKVWKLAFLVLILSAQWDEIGAQ